MPFMIEQACADQTGTITVGMRGFARAVSPAGSTATAGRMGFTEPTHLCPLSAGVRQRIDGAWQTRCDMFCA
jgi:hypothetical protein